MADKVDVHKAVDSVAAAIHLTGGTISRQDIMTVKSAYDHFSAEFARVVTTTGPKPTETDRLRWREAQERFTLAHPEYGPALNRWAEAVRGIDPQRLARMMQRHRAATQGGPLVTLN